VALPEIRSPSSTRSGASTVSSTRSSRRDIQKISEDQLQKRRIFALRKLSQKKIRSTANTSPDFRRTAQYLNKCQYEFTDRIKSLREKRLKRSSSRLQITTINTKEDLDDIDSTFKGSMTDRGIGRSDSVYVFRNSPMEKSPTKRGDMSNFDWNDQSIVESTTENDTLKEPVQNGGDNDKLPVISESKSLASGNGQRSNENLDLMKLKAIKVENESLDNVYVKTNHLSELRNCRKKYERIIELNNKILGKWAKVDDRREELDKLCSFLMDKFRAKIKIRLSEIIGPIGVVEVKAVTEEITGLEIKEQELENLVELIQLDSLTATKQKLTDRLALCNSRQSEVHAEIKIVRDRMRMLLEEESKIKQRKVISKEGVLNKLANERETLTEMISRLEATSDEIDQMREQDMIKLSMLHKLPSPKDPFSLESYDGREIDPLIESEQSTLQKPREEFFSQQSPVRRLITFAEEPVKRKRSVLKRKKTEAYFMPQGLSIRRPSIEHLKIENVFQRSKTGGDYPFFSQRNRMLAKKESR